MKPFNYGNSINRTKKGCGIRTIVSYHRYMMLYLPQLEALSFFLPCSEGGEWGQKPHDLGGRAFEGWMRVRVGLKS
jgi:hypothetical protein